MLRIGEAEGENKMNANTVDLVIAAMRLLSENERRIEFLIDAAGSGKLSLDKKDYRRLVDEIIRQFFSEKEMDYWWMLRKQLKDRLLPSLTIQALQDLLTASASLMEDFIIKVEAMSDGDKINRPLCSLIFDEVIFLFQSNTVEGNQGARNRLVRIFAEACDKEFLGIAFAKLAEDLTRNQDIMDVLAEGAIKCEGPWKVWQFYGKATKGKKERPSEAGSIEACRQALRNAIGAYNLSDQSSIDKCKKLFGELVDLYDGDTVLALKTVEETREDLLPEFTPKYSDKSSGGKRAE